jgi:hypothetical protein
VNGELMEAVAVVILFVVVATMIAAIVFWAAKA